MSLLARLSGVAILGLILTGCASIVTGTTQTLNVQVLDAQSEQMLSGAQCNIVDGDGRTYKVIGNPGAVVVTKGRGALSVNCKKPGYRQSQLGVGQSFNAWTFANVIFWPGVLVDAATGAIQKYPSHVTVLMEPIE